MKPSGLEQGDGRLSPWSAWRPAEVDAIWSDRSWTAAVSALEMDDLEQGLLEPKSDWIDELELDGLAGWDFRCPSSFLLVAVGEHGRCGYPAACGVVDRAPVARAVMPLGERTAGPCRDVRQHGVPQGDHVVCPGRWADGAELRGAPQVAELSGNARSRPTAAEPADRGSLGSREPFNRAGISS